jgi:hypothetical protein
LSEQYDVQIKLRLENKTKNVPPIWGQSSSIVTTVDVNINNNNNTNTNNNNNVNDEDFVTSTSSSSVTSSSSDTSNNVVFVTTPSFVPPDIEPSLSSHYFSPTVTPFGESSDTPPHSPSFDDDEAAASTVT